MPVFPGPVCRHLHFPKLNNICHFSDHLINLSMSSCNFCLSPISLAFLNSLASSASFNILPVTHSSKSLSYTINKIGPSTDPCGTPRNTDFQLETSPSTKGKGKGLVFNNYHLFPASEPLFYPVDYTVSHTW